MLTGQSHVTWSQRPLCLGASTSSLGTDALLREASLLLPHGLRGGSAGEEPDGHPAPAAQGSSGLRGAPVPQCPVRSLVGGCPRAVERESRNTQCLGEEQAAGQVRGGGGRPGGSEGKESACQELFTEAMQRNVLQQM